MMEKIISINNYFKFYNDKIKLFKIYIFYIRIKNIATIEIILPFIVIKICVLIYVFIFSFFRMN